MKFVWWLSIIYTNNNNYKTNKDKYTDTFPPLLPKATYICARVMQTAKCFNFKAADRALPFYV